MATTKRAKKSTTNRGGRPTRAGQASGERVIVRLTRDERARLEREAERAGLSLSAYMRLRLLSDETS